MLAFFFAKGAGRNWYLHFLTSWDPMLKFGMDKCENILFLEFFFRISIHFWVMLSSFVSFEKKIYCTFSSFLIFFSKRNLEKLVTVVFVKGKSTLVLNYSHWPCQASILTIQRGDFSKTTLIGKKSNYVIQLFER